MEMRLLGETGEKLSIIGLGGIVISDLEQKEADRIVAEAVARGVNYFDVAPTYGDAEERLGPALEAYRSQAFLACKTIERDGKKAAQELERSLRRLRTEYLDLYQLHGLTSAEEVGEAFGAAGAMETLQDARQAGKVRFLGFSAHSAAAAQEALRRFAFDAVLFPVNYACWYAGFGPQVLEMAKQEGAGRLALKAMARAPWPEGSERKWKKCWYQPLEEREEAILALRFTLSQDITAAIPPGEAELFQMALDIAEDFRPLTSEEVEEVQEMARRVEPLFAPA